MEDGQAAGNKVAKQEIAMIKVAAPNMALQVIDWAMQVHGGAGVSDDFPLARPTPRRARCATPTAPTRCIATRSPSRSRAVPDTTAGLRRAIDERLALSRPDYAPRHLWVPQTNLFFNVEVSAARFPDKPFMVFYDTRDRLPRFKEERERLAG